MKPKRYLDISAGYIKTPKVKARRKAARAQIRKAGGTVVKSSAVYGHSSAPTLKKEE